MPTITQKTEAKRLLWKARNYGALTRVARELNLSPQFVAEVFRGLRTSRNRQVEVRLSQLGCPGFEQDEAQNG